MTLRSNVIPIFGLLIGATIGAAGAQTGPVPIEAAELERRSDLIGQSIAVDDRVAYYVPRQGTQDDELQLKRTGVTFLVPRRLRPAEAQRIASVVVRGILRRDGGRLFCEVTEIIPQASDRDRLDRAIADLSPTDFASRQSWAAWAERRARDFKDSALLGRVRAIESDALRIRSDMKRVAVDAPQERLTLAKDAKRRQVPEPEPSAQAHRAFRAMLSRATSILELTSLIQEIDGFFPDARTDRASGGANLARWEKPYSDDPAGAYRIAGADIRKALDRRLWADATERRLDLEASADVKSALDAAEKAGNLLPERPELSERLTKKGLDRARQDLAAMRLADVKSLASVYRERLHQPKEALNLLRDWLKTKQDRLSSTDAEGPVGLAALYEELLEDRVTAIELLRRAWAIDPSSKEIAEAFRTRGYRREKDDWIESVPEQSEKSNRRIDPAATGVVSSQGLRGLSAEEVGTRIGGKPDRVNFIGSKGQMIEQWIYYLDTKQVRFVNLLHAPGELKPRVVSDYSLPLIRFKDGAGSAR
jgi:tetratricopeptide (TPR) repeat protein